MTEYFTPSGNGAILTPENLAINQRTFIESSRMAHRVTHEFFQGIDPRSVTKDQRKLFEEYLGYILSLHQSSAEGTSQRLLTIVGNRLHKMMYDPQRGSYENILQAARAEATYLRYMEAGEPFFTGEWFRVPFATDHPSGFDIETQKVELRRKGIVDFPAHRVNQANARAREEIREKLQKAENRRAQEEGRDPQKIPLKDATITGKEFGAKVVVREIHEQIKIDPQTNTSRPTLELTIAPSPYYSFKEFSGINEGELGEKLGNIAGVAMMIVTKDGKIIVQKRGKNGTYGDDINQDAGRGIPGASAAGTLDATFYPTAKGPHGEDLRGKIRPVDSTYIKGGMEREAIEENGLHPDEISFIVVEYIEDKINPHVEFGQLGQTTLDGKEAAERAIKNRQITRGDFDFAERIMVLDFVDVGKLLTEVHVPVPPTHAAIMMAAYKKAYRNYLVGQRILTPERIADLVERKMAEIQSAYQQNNQTINRLVRQFYMLHPQALQTNKENVPTLNELGYDPRIFGIHQGIPALDNELKRVGIHPEDILRLEEEK